jgi:hypothetical protein
MELVMFDIGATFVLLVSHLTVVVSSNLASSQAAP